MRIDEPQCDFRYCRYEIDGNCTAANSRKWCEYAGYRSAEAENRLVVLPCKVGDMLYGINQKRICEFVADEFIYSNNHWYVMGTHGEGEFDIADCRYTQAEAEAALSRKEAMNE